MLRIMIVNMPTCYEVKYYETPNILIGTYIGQRLLGLAHGTCLCAGHVFLQIAL
jgi:hypothetical protein